MAGDPEKMEESNKLDNEGTSSDFNGYDTDTDTDTSIDIDPQPQKTIADLKSTSVDVNSTLDGVPSEASKKPSRRHSNDSKLSEKFDPNSTDEFEFEQFEDTQDEVQDGPLTDDSVTSKKDEKFHRPSSILDLIKGKDDALPIVNYEENSDLDKRLEGKTLDDVLKITQKDKERWHESKRAKAGDEEKAVSAKNRQRKFFIATPLIVMFAGVICFYIILPTFAPPTETDAIKFPKRKRKAVTPEKLKIDPNLKDQDKLEKYLKMADKLFSDKKIDKAEIVYTKLLPTGWHSENLLVRIGECRDKQKDTKGAIEFYSKAIKAGYASDVDIPLRLGTLLNEQQKYQEIYDVLSPLQEKFANKTPFLILLANSYWQLKMPEKTLSAFRSLNKQFLTQEQLKIYADLLMQKDDKKEAFNVYLFLAQNFQDTESFIKASEVAPNPKLKIAVLTELTGKTLGKPGWNYYNLLLGESMIAQGQKKDALRVLEKIKVEKLKGESALRFLKLLANFENVNSLFEACETILTKKYINNLPVQEEIRDVLIDSNHRKLAEKIFSKQVVKFKHSPIANYMFATVTSSIKLKKKYYSLALGLQPGFFSASLALGKLYFDEGNLDNAITKFKQCIDINSKAKAPRYLLAVVRIRKTEDLSALKEYHAFLEENRTSEPIILKQMLLLAQHLPTSTEAMKYLKEMEKFPQLKQFLQIQTIRTKLMYGTLKETDFKGMTAKGLKKYRILFLLGEGKIKQVMLMPTLKSEFPEYWKVFLCWKKNISSWRGNSQLLMFKHSNNPLIVMSAKLWLWEISPLEAEMQIGRLPYEDKILFYLMIAECYRKDNNKVKASIAYLTAMRYKQPNLYSKVVKYFKNH
jgi:tetratricopeptide repeat protein